MSTYQIAEVTTFASTMRPGMKTVLVPGTEDKAVTFDPTAYAGQAVYLHDASRHPYDGEAIGSLGAIVYHGAYAQMGQPSNWGTVPEDRMWASWTERSGPAEVAIRMARIHLSIEELPENGRRRSL